MSQIMIIDKLVLTCVMRDNKRCRICPKRRKKNTWHENMHYEEKLFECFSPNFQIWMVVMKLSYINSIASIACKFFGKLLQREVKSPLLSWRYGRDKWRGATSPEEALVRIQNSFVWNLFFYWRSSRCVVIS